MNKYVLAAVFAVMIPFAVLLGSAEEDGAALGQSYMSCRDLHKQTRYGSLFLNVGHFLPSASKNNRDYQIINGNGDLRGLPDQEGYCFVFNHYSESTAGRPHHYTAVITKRKRDGNSSQENVRRPYKPTDSRTSCRLPDLCVVPSEQVKGINIRFSSTDKDYFDRNISLRLR